MGVQLEDRAPKQGPDEGGREPEAVLGDERKWQPLALWQSRTAVTVVAVTKHCSRWLSNNKCVLSQLWRPQVRSPGVGSL